MEEKSKILSVDLDGTLIKSDMLYETFWSSFSEDLLIPFKAILALLKGKAYLKNFLYKSSKIDIKTLPYNDLVIEYIKEHRASGGKVALVTASSQKIADRIAKHLNLFDFIYGSSQQTNLNGLTKANLQKKIFGINNFDYIGNSLQDIESWKISKKAITLNANKYIRKRCELFNENNLHLKNKNRPNFFKYFIKQIRPNQWIKNILVFLPIFAAQDFNTNSFFNAFLAFISFSLTASSVYILNDLLDIKEDRNHPKKCNRPFASGNLSFSLGSIGGIVLFIFGVIIGFILKGSFLTILLTYYSITISYSLFFKKKVLVDIFILSGLYALRILAGGTASNLNISFWLIAFSIFIFLSLAAIKRQTEIIDLIDRGKSKIEKRGYKLSDLEFIRILALSSGLVSTLVLSLYINSPKVLELYSKLEFLWIACCLYFFWIIRICFKTDRGEMEYDPIIFTFKDKLSRLIIASIIVLVLFAKLL